MSIADYVATEDNIALSVKALGTDMDEVVYAVSTDEAGNKFYDYQVKIKGLTRQAIELNLLDLEITVALYVVVDGETLYSETVSYSYNSITALMG